ncbi:MAG: hypothetical protein ABIW49_06125 [Knoellia sp.]
MLSDLRKRRRMPSLTLALAATLVVVSGCAGRGSVEQDAVISAAGRFLESARTDPAAACDLLAPATLEELGGDGETCTTGVADVAIAPMSGDVVDAQVFGRDAMVRAGEATLFLARFDEGWLVTAAGCTPRGNDLPYDCSIEGR